jgi:hypothetical protein
VGFGQEPARLCLVLGALVTYNTKRAAGLRLVANAISWEHGIPDQPEVLGSAVAMAMGLALRPAAQVS